MKNITLSGYYGFNNAGDEAVLYSIIEALQKLNKNIEITVLSNNPEQTASLYNVQAVNRWKMGEVFEQLRKTDLLISGGGSLLQDVTSKNGILYYLGIIGMARLLRKKVLIYSQGIGPINYKSNKILVKKLLNSVQGITLRDEKSKLELESIGVKKEIITVADPVLGLNKDDIEIDRGWELLQRGNVSNKGKVLGISLRNWDKVPLNWEALGQACDYFASEGWQTVFIPMHYPEDISAAREVIKYMKKDYILLKENYTPYDIICIFKAVDMILGMRLHSLIMGAVVQKPLVALSYDPKVDRFMTSLDSQDIIPVNDIEETKLIAMLNKTWQNRQDILAKQNQKLTKLHQQALLPAEIAMEILGA